MKQIHQHTTFMIIYTNFQVTCTYISCIAFIFRASCSLGSPNLGELRAPDPRPSPVLRELNRYHSFMSYFYSRQSQRCSTVTLSHTMFSLPVAENSQRYLQIPVLLLFDRSGKICYAVSVITQQLKRIKLTFAFSNNQVLCHSITSRSCLACCPATCGRKSHLLGPSLD